MNFDERGLFFGQGVFFVETGPEACALAFVVIVKEASVGFASQAAFGFEPEDKVVRWAFGIIRAHRSFGRAGNFCPQINRGFIVELKRADRETKLACGVVDQRGRDPFGDHTQAFVDVGDDAAVGVEEACIIHNDRGFADLAHIVERLGNSAVACLCAFDDLDQKHFLNG